MARQLQIKSTGKVITLEEFFKAFGYSQDDTIYFRLFEDNEQKRNTSDGLWWNEKQKRTCGKNYKCKLSELAAICSMFDRYNKDNTAGVYFTVNGGGTSDADVLASGIARAQFFEIDSMSFAEQEAVIRNSPLKPSVIVKTAKSYHTYFLLKEGNISRFRAIQSQLADFFQGDKSVKNESRVMRVPSFYHNKAGKVMVEVQWFNPEIKYTQDEIIKAFQKAGTSFSLEGKKETISEPVNENNVITESNRHNTFYMLTCRCIEAGLTHGAINKALLHDNQVRCKPPLPDSEIESIIECAYKYRKGEAGRTAYRMKKRAEVLAAYED